MCFPMRPWFRAPGWTPPLPHHSLLAGTVGSCPAELGTLCCSLTSQSQKERLRGSGSCVWRPGQGIWELVGGILEVGASIWVLALPRVALDETLALSLVALLPVSRSNVESEASFPLSPLTSLGLSSLRLDPSSHHPLLGGSAPWGSGVLFLTSSWKLRVFLHKLPQGLGAVGSNRKGTNLQPFP